MSSTTSAGPAGGAAGPPPGKRRLYALGLVALVLAVYGRVATHEFVNYDVGAYLLENPPVRAGLTWEGVRWAFTSAHSANWHPLTWLSHMLDVELWGLAPAGHHLTNVALHAANAVLLLVFLTRATGRFVPSLVVAALFALHPLRVESVAWAAERKDVLSGLFWMLTLLAYERWARRPSGARYAAVAGALAAGLLAKPMLVTLPFVLLLLDVWPLRRPLVSRRIVEKLPLLALALGSSIVTFLVQRAEGVTHDALGLPLAHRAANALVAYATYLGKTLWPTDLACFYPHPSFVGGDLAATLFGPAVAAGVLLALLSAVALAARRRAPELLVGWAWFLGTLVPVIGLVQVGHQAWADRYAYVTLIGPYVAVVFGADRWLARRAPGVRRAAGVLAGAALGALALASAAQVGVWRDSTTLWEHALRSTEGNYMAHHLHGATLAAAGRLEEAEGHLAEALRIRPAHFPAHFTWADALEAAGRDAEAGRHWREVVRIAPRYAPGLFRWARHLAGTGDAAGAVEAYQRGLALEPASTDARLGLGLALGQLERLDEAAACFREVLRARPRDAEAHYALGYVALRRERLEEALEHLRHAVEVRPAYAEAHANLGYVYARLGRPADARRHLEEALRLDPGQAQARATLDAL